MARRWGGREGGTVRLFRLCLTLVDARTADFVCMGKCIKRL
jgi:hypothetical protein